MNLTQVEQSGDNRIHANNTQRTLFVNSILLKFFCRLFAGATGSSNGRCRRANSTGFARKNEAVGLADETSKTCEANVLYADP
jgi:hypothetical protein